MSRAPKLLCLLVAIATIAASPAWPVTDAVVSRFVVLSDQFNAQLSKSSVRGLSKPQRVVRARCILGRIEDDFGQGGVSALMNMMKVLSKGTEFDDATVVSFNEAYGRDYNRALNRCGRAARNS